MVAFLRTAAGFRRPSAYLAAVVPLFLLFLLPPAVRGNEPASSGPEAARREAVGIGGQDVLPAAEARDLVPALRRRVRRARRDVEARRRLASILARSRSPEERREAVTLLTEALRIAPDDVGLWSLLAHLQERRGFYGEAEKAFRRALALAPERADLWGALAAHELGRFRRRTRWTFLDEARRDNDRCLALAPDDTVAVERAVRMAALEGNDAALDSLVARWEDLCPRNPWPLLVRGMRWTEAGAWDRARSAFAAGIAQLSPGDREAFLSLALVDDGAEEERTAATDSTRYWRDFWRWRDPTPADAENPVLLEHYRRLVKAELLFGTMRGKRRGWEQTPGRMIVRYGLPRDWSYRNDVRRTGSYWVSPGLSVPAVRVRFGQDREPLFFTFVDYNLNGTFLSPVESVARNEDFFVAEVPSLYEEASSVPPRPQRIEMWRFDGGPGTGRIEVAVALPPDGWPAPVLDRPFRLASRVALYDRDWNELDSAVGSWARFRRDPLGRLVGIFRMAPSADSVIVGVETEERRHRGRAADYATLAPEAVRTGFRLSDVAFLSDVRFGEPGGPYRWAYGTGLPNPGHRYRVSQPVGIGFEVYGLAVDSTGTHHLQVSVSVGRRSKAGWFPIHLPGSRGKRAGRGFRYETSGSGPVHREVLSVALPALRPGAYTLRLAVEDRVGGRRVRRSERFTIVAGKERP